jgi:hypothetical protein
MSTPGVQVRFSPGSAIKQAQSACPSATKSLRYAYFTVFSRLWPVFFHQTVFADLIVFRDNCH